MGETGKELLTIVEIDCDKCSRVYGVSPCTAAVGVTGAAKCYNTFATCQDRANYLKGDPLTLRFATNQSGLPKTGTVFPALDAAPQISAAEINLSGIDPRTSALGKRARVSVTLKDFTYHDTLTDPYVSERGYDPAERGTFFAKLAARNPYYVGRALRVRSGYVGQDFAAMDTRNYVITEWNGPNAAGTVEVTAKDVLDLADNAKAVAPAASRGKLAAAITAADTTATLSPATVGSEYPASGLVCIGREVMRFTRTGDVLTFTARGLEGTQATAHNVNDVAQVCAEWVDQRICDVIRDLLVTYAGVDSAFIDLTAWQAENDRWLGGIKVGSVITKPTGVASLIGEICQHGVLVWWDEVAQEIRFQPNRPLDIGEEYYPVTDAANLIRGTLEVERAEDMRASQVHFYHGLIDPTDYAEDGNKFNKLVVAAALDEESANAYGEARIKELHSRWLGRDGDDPAAAAIATRLINRYRNTPKVISGQLDVKDKASVDLAGLLEVQSYLLTDADGLNLPEPMQVSYLAERNDRLEFKAQTFTFSGRYGVIAEDTRGDYPAATAEEKRKGSPAL